MNENNKMEQAPPEHSAPGAAKMKSPRPDRNDPSHLLSLRPSIWQQIHNNSIALLSLIVAIAGFSYNVYSIEKQERNTNYRNASFQIFIELSALEELTFHLHYDDTGSARSGWTKVLLIDALASLLPSRIKGHAEEIKATWAQHWDALGKPVEVGENPATTISDAIEMMRREVIQFVETLD